MIFTPRQAEAVRLHMKGETQARIAERMGISRQGVSRLLKRAQARLKALGTMFGEHKTN